MQCVATRDEVEAFQTHQAWTEPLRGVLVEIAATGVLRYPWNLLAPLFRAQLERTLGLYEGEDVDEKTARLGEVLKSFAAAPFTVQRLAEVLLEPKKQYSRLEKVTSALEKLLTVTATLPVSQEPPALPLLSALPPVNCNPPTVVARRMSSSEAFRGFLEEKRRTTNVNGAASGEGTNLVGHLLTVDDAAP